MGTQHGRGLMARVFPVRKGEWGRVGLSAACFFFLLFGYFLLRPIREAMGVQRSMSDLRWLFITTCFVSLIVTLAFGGVVSRMDRRRFIALAYRAVMVCLLGFIVARQVLSDELLVYSGYVYYVGLSVVNLFMTSVFWGFMADVWSLSQGKRLFAAIGIGGTLGALLGSNFVWWLASHIPTWVQIGVAIVAFELAVQCVGLIDRRSGTPVQAQVNPAMGAPVGGQWVDGFQAMMRSPYLLGIGLYIMLLAISNTMIYFTQAKLVVDASDELSGRIALFAQLDMWTQVATLLVQLFVTAHIIKRLGIGVALALLPIVTLAGFALLAWVSRVEGVQGWQVFAVFAIFNAIHRATRYAVVRPARETLFSVVPSSEKYKAKPIVDVFLYRGGDVAGAGVERVIAAMGWGLMGMAMVAAPLAVLWGGLAFALARSQHRRAMDMDESNEVELKPTSTIPGGALGPTGRMT
ncbi:MAG: MFS transporter [Phycisphaerae bacterium]|nr:MFS transporter [Phycisphaerae bacterium]